MTRILPVALFCIAILQLHCAEEQHSKIKNGREVLILQQPLVTGENLNAQFIIHRRVRNAADLDVIMQRPLGYQPPESLYFDGHPCTFNSDCLSSCCLQQNGNNTARMCHPLASKGERCNYFQLKGGRHVNVCPCSSGVEFCKRSPRSELQLCTQ